VRAEAEFGRVALANDDAAGGLHARKHAHALAHAPGVDPEVLADTLVGVVWGMAFQISSNARPVVAEVGLLLSRGWLRDR